MSRASAPSQEACKYKRWGAGVIHEWIDTRTDDKRTGTGSHVREAVDSRRSLALHDWTQLSCVCVLYWKHAFTGFFLETTRHNTCMEPSHTSKQASVFERGEVASVLLCDSNNIHTAKPHIQYFALCDNSFPVSAFCEHKLLTNKAKAEENTAPRAGFSKPKWIFYTFLPLFYDIFVEAVQLSSSDRRAPRECLVELVSLDMSGRRSACPSNNYTVSALAHRWVVFLSFWIFPLFQGEDGEAGNPGAVGYPGVAVSHITSVSSFSPCLYTDCLICGSGC